MLSPVTHDEAERDRKACIALDIGGGGRRELAQWLLDHPHYSNILVAQWLSCSRNRLYYLRRWAEKGFVGKPHDLRNHPDKRWGENRQMPREPKPQDAPLEVQTDMAPPEVIEESVIYCLERMNVHARMFKKQFKATPFDAEARKRITFAIERMIRNWRQTQSILTREKRR